MASRDHFDHAAAGIASLEPRDPERMTAKEHARGCNGCAEALREAEQLMTLIDSAPAPPLSPEMLERLSRRVTRATITRRASSPSLVIAAVLATSLVLAFATGESGGFDLLVGLHCALVELVAAAAPYAVLAYLVVRGRRPGSAPGFAATAAAGALAGQLYLLLRCPARMDTPHLLVTHAGAVVLAALLGWIGGIWLPERAAGGAQ